MEAKPTTKPEEIFTIAKLSMEDALESLANIKTMGVVMQFIGEKMTKSQQNAYVQTLMQAHTSAQRSVAMIDNLLKVVAQSVQHEVQLKEEVDDGNEQEGTTG